MGEPTEGNWIAADDYYRNVKALDVALNGADGAARPMLIDILSQVEAEVRKRGAPLLRPLAGSGDKFKGFDRRELANALDTLDHSTEPAIEFIARFVRTTLMGEAPFHFTGEDARRKADTTHNRVVDEAPTVAKRRRSEPLERLRFFCSLALGEQDWIEVAPLFAAVERAIEPVTAPTNDEKPNRRIVDATQEFRINSTAMKVTQAFENARIEARDECLWLSKVCREVIAENDRLRVANAALQTKIDKLERP